MTTHSIFTRRLSLNLMALLFGASIVSPAPAEEMPISDIPLFLTSSITPNVFFEVDDSGSMDWSILTKKHWHFCAYDATYQSAENLVNQDCGWEVTDGLWRAYNTDASGTLMRSQNFRYIFSSSDNAYGDFCGNGNNASLETCGSGRPYATDWRIRSADFNVVYFDPSIEYEPWNGPCTGNAAACTNADFASARSNPRQGESGYSVTRDLDGFSFEVWTDDKGYTGNRPHRGTSINISNGANGEIDLWDTHTRYTISGNTITLTRTSYSANAASASGFDTATSNTTLSGTTCFTELYPNDPQQCRTIAETKQNIANWFQYHRRRSFVAKNAIASVVSDNTSYRYGLSVLNQYSSLFVESPSAGTTNFIPHNRDMLAQLFSLNWPTSGTPLRRGLERVGKYFDEADTTLGLANPIIGSCQKNFAILFTDGYWNGNAPAIQNADNDPYSGTLADVAKYYYDKDLSITKQNNVPTDKFDTNNKQHLVTFTVAFGVKGNLTDTDNPLNGWPDDGNGNDLKENSDWGNPGNSEPAKIDDLWHAAYNSRGTYVAASTASEVVSALAKALLNIEKRSASASSVAVDSGLVGGASHLYMAGFDSADWTGSLKGIPIDPQTGEPDFGSPSWEAADVLPTWNNRAILTQEGTTVNNGGKAFRWSSLTTDQQTILKTALTGSAAAIELGAQNRLKHIRGDSSQELRNGGMFRDRPESRLGDVVNSSPIYVGSPDFSYTFDGYPDFRKTYEPDPVTNQPGRTPIVYVGANDGMLHGFKAETGEEVLAYIPKAVFKNLPQLTEPDYSHRYYVDGALTEGDAYFDANAANGGSKAWHTVLLGSLNKGGQGVFALDITNPGNFNESNTSTVLWDFTDADDNDSDGDGTDDPIGNPEPANSMRHNLGDTFSRPAIVRLANGQWAAIFGNGYNSSRADGHGSINGDAVLYILDIGTGKIIRKISTETGADEDPEAYMDAQGNTIYRHRANGLPTTAPVDVNGDHIIDYVYSGDLFGNLWKFDLRDPNPQNWDVSFRENGRPAPFFTACAGTCSKGLNSTYQPVTTRPEVGRSLDRYGLMVYFGTGKYLANEDITDHRTQTFYALIDSGNGRLTGSRDTLLQKQSILTEATASFTGSGGSTVSSAIRVTSNTPIGNMQGWYMDLLPPSGTGVGERVIKTPILRSGRIIFATSIPTSDSCGFGGNSWLMELDAYEGQRLSTSVFDMNNDGKLDAQDTVNGTTVSGMGLTGLSSTPAILSAGNTEMIYIPNSDGSVNAVSGGGDESEFGRQSWRQLR